MSSKFEDWTLVIITYYVQIILNDTLKNDHMQFLGPYKTIEIANETLLIYYTLKSIVLLLG